MRDMVCNDGLRTRPGLCAVPWLWKSRGCHRLTSVAEWRSPVFDDAFAIHGSGMLALGSPFRVPSPSSTHMRTPAECQLPPYVLPSRNRRFSSAQTATASRGGGMRPSSRCSAADKAHAGAVAADT